MVVFEIKLDHELRIMIICFSKLSVGCHCEPQWKSTGPVHPALNLLPMEKHTPLLISATHSKLPLYFHDRIRFLNFQ